MHAVDPITPVACGSCHRCCRNEVIALQENESPAAYECDIHVTPIGTIYALKHKPNGDCIYLGDNGCTIHGRHPAICRVFDCVGFASLWPPARCHATGMKVTDVLLEGRRRMGLRKTK